MSYTTIFLGTALVVLIMYMLFQSYFDGKQSLVSQTKLSNAAEWESVSKPNASIFYYGIWVHIGQWTNGEGQSLFKRDSELNVYFTSTAGLKVKVEDDANDPSDIVVTNNFPIQKWVHIGIVIDNQIMDVYLDGKMVKSVKLKDTISTKEKKTDGSINKIVYGKVYDDTGVATSDADIAPYTHIAEHIRMTYAIDPKGMWDLYMEGNGMGGLTQAASEMNVNLSILKYGVESSKISLW